MSCGVNVLTNATATDGLGLLSEQCYIPAGWGSVFDSKTQQLVASKCGKGTYGQPEPVYGLGAAPCQSCPDNMITPDQIPTLGNETRTSPDAIITSAYQCITRPGYGWDDDSSAALLCPEGYYAQGHNHEDCIQCGVGLQTAGPGAVSTMECISQGGWYKWHPTDIDAQPCPMGTYAEVGASSCRKCPMGTSTEGPEASSASQCSVCAAGWGIDGSTSQCVICTEGFFSPGGAREPCAPCDAGQTSLDGASSSADCFAPFVQLAVGTVVSTPAAAWLAVSANATNSCQAACSAEARCQYWMLSGAGICSLKLATTAPAQDTYVSIKLSTGNFAIWQSAADEYGLQAQGVKPLLSQGNTSADPWRCLSSCDNNASCLAVHMTKVDGRWSCWMLSAAGNQGSAVSAIKVAQSQLNKYYWDRPGSSFANNATCDKAATPLTITPPNPSPSPNPSASNFTVTSPPGTGNNTIPGPTVSPSPSPSNSRGNNNTIPGPAASPSPFISTSPAGPYCRGPYIINTVAGGGGSYNSPIPAKQAYLNKPSALALDQFENLYFTDFSLRRVYKLVPTTGTLTVVAGNGTDSSGGDGGPATAASLRHPAGVVVDPSTGDVFISDWYSNVIRKIDGKTGIISTIAGGGTASGEGIPASTAAINYPYYMLLDRNGSLLFSEWTGGRIRKMDLATGLVTTLKGAVGLQRPSSFGFDPAGNLIIMDQNMNAIRRLDMVSGTLSNLMATPFPYPSDLAVDATGDVLMTDGYSNQVFKVSAATGELTSVAGSTQGLSGDGGPATDAKMYAPTGMAITRNGTIFLGAGDSRVRVLSCSSTLDGPRPSPSPSPSSIFPLRSSRPNCTGSPYTVNTIAGGGTSPKDGVQATQAMLINPMGLALDRDGNVIYTDAQALKVRKVDVKTGVISTVAGSGMPGLSGDGGPATAASFASGLYGVVVDPTTGDIFIGDRGNSRIRKVIAATGNISTVASGLGGPTDLAMDQAGNLLFSETYRVRRISAVTGQIDVVLGTTVAQPTYLDTQSGITIDKAGALYIAYPYGKVVKRVNMTTGEASTIGNGTLGYPYDMAADASGRLFITDAQYATVMVVAANGTLTKAGQVQSPYGIAVGQDGTVFVADTAYRQIKTLSCPDV